MKAIYRVEFCETFDGADVCSWLSGRAKDLARFGLKRMDAERVSLREYNVEMVYGSDRVCDELEKIMAVSGHIDAYWRLNGPDKKGRFAMPSSWINGDDDD